MSVLQTGTLRKGPAPQSRAALVSNATHLPPPPGAGKLLRRLTDRFVGLDVRPLRRRVAHRPQDGESPMNILWGCPYCPHCGWRSVALVNPSTQTSRQALDRQCMNGSLESTAQPPCVCMLACRTCARLWVGGCACARWRWCWCECVCVCVCARARARVCVCALCVVHARSFTSPGGRFPTALTIVHKVASDLF